MKKKQEETYDILSPIEGGWKMKSLNVLIAVGAALMAILLMGTYLKYMGADYYSSFSHLRIITHESLANTIDYCITTPLMEEALWRWAPMSIIVPICTKFKMWEKLKWPIVILLSINFGLWHGSTSRVFVQGLSSIFIYWVYIRNGYSYLSAVATHGLYNLIWSTLLYNFL